MDGPRMLSGSELVAKGVKKVDIKLPELGCKDVSPSGSWLEQKQIQSALEARKHLIEVERIDKLASISHAIWRDDLNLAEVTQKVGGHWNYIGHNVREILYLRPEETLYLLEINALLLKHNDVTVSLQKAYKLCLGDISIAQYKVYASLSRLGYKVVRHHDTTNKIKLKKPTDVVNDEGNSLSDISLNNNESTDIINDDTNKASDDSSDLKSDNTDETLEVRNIPKEVPALNVPFNQSDNDSNLSLPLIEADNVKVEIVENHTGSEISENDINNAIEKTLQSSGVDPSNESKDNGDEITPMDQETEEVIDNENVQNSVNRDTAASPNIKREYSPVMNVECNVNETISLPTDDNENIVTTSSANANVEMPNILTFSSDLVYSVDQSGEIRVFGEKRLESMDIDDMVSDAEKRTVNVTSEAEVQDPCSVNKLKPYEIEINYYKAKMQQLVNRKSLQTRNREGLNCIQDFFMQGVVTIQVPDEKTLPRNIFTYKTSYTLNLDTVRSQNSSNSNMSGDEMDVAGVGSSRSSRGTDVPRFSELPRFGPTPYSGNFRYQHYRPYFRMPHEWMYRQNMYYGYNSFRPPMHYFAQPRYRFQHINTRNHFMNYNLSQGDNRRNTMKTMHFNTIVGIAARFKNISGGAPPIDALYRLVTTYNSHYGEHIELTRNFDIIERKVQAAEVVVLDDDEKPKRKKQRPDEGNRTDSNLGKLKALAAKLKELQMKDVALSRHRRVFSNAIKTFNKTYKADIYLDSNFEIKDRKLIVLDSSSGSDVICVVEKGKRKKRKKVRNPYSVLKHGLKNVNEGASTSRENPESIPSTSNGHIDEANGACMSDVPVSSHNGEELSKYFQKQWLVDDFGSPAVCSRESARLDSILFETEYMNGVMTDRTADCDNWLEVKIAILKDIQGSLDLHKEQAEALNHDFLMETESQIQPIVGPDCKDLKSVLQRLAIIPTDEEIPKECNLRIDFDVCNRNIQFKKTNPPKPHFRIICLDESALFPSSVDIVALNSKYNDDVPAVFAFVGTGAISYLQVNDINLPVFISDSDLT